MNPEAREELARITAVEPAALTDSDKGFLRARRSYLSEEQKAVYKDVLADVKAAETPVESSEEQKESVEAPKKAKK